MKKIISLTIACTLLLLCLCACGKVSEDAQAVIDQIKAIGVVTERSGSAIAAAEAAYNQLSEEDKSTVKNYSTLESARTAYDELVSEDAQSVIEQIEALGEITKESKAAIAKAEAAYALLSEDEKSVIFNYDTLQAARATYDGIRKELEGTLTYCQAYIGDDLSAYLPDMAGGMIPLGNDIVDAVLFADRDTIIVLTTEGTLYRTSSEDVNIKTTISENVLKLSTIRPTGFFFVDGSEDIYRYKIEDSSVTFAGKAIYVAANTLTVLCADQDNIYYMTENMSECEKLMGWSCPSLSLEGISDDGSIAVWVERDTKAGSHTTYMYERGDRTLVEKITSSSYASAYVHFNQNQTWMAIADYNSSTLYFKNGTEDLNSAKLGAEISIAATIYTKNGDFDYDTNDTVDGFYIRLDSDNGDSLYFVDTAGDRERVLSGIKDVRISNSTIYYLTVDYELYYAELDDESIKNEIKISSDVVCFQPALDNDCVYYMKNKECISGSDYTASLYYWNVSDKENVKISSDAYICYLSALDIYLTYFNVTPDGSQVLYYKDVDTSHEEIGTLMLGSSSGESTKIATDVIVSTIPGLSGLKRGYSAEGFVFRKYVADDKDGKSLVNVLWWNGSETTVLAKDIKIGPDRESKASGKLKTT